MQRITSIDVGGTMFARSMMCDIFSFPELKNTEIQSFINRLIKLDQSF